MKLRALQTFICYLGPIHIGDEFVVNLDINIIQEWIDNGLVEEANPKRKKSVSSDENK